MTLGSASRKDHYKVLFYYSVWGFIVCIIVCLLDQGIKGIKYNFYSILKKQLLNLDNRKCLICHQYILFIYFLFSAQNP